MTTQLFDLQPETLASDLVVLAPLTEKDFDRLFAVASDPLIWELHPNRDRYKKDVFQLYFDGAVESRGAFLVFDRATGELIGCTRFYDLQPEQSSIAIGYTFLARKYWGGSYNRSMKKLLLDHAFRFVDKVMFHIGSANLRSQKAILKLGAVKINEVDFGPRGNEQPHYEYEIKRSDWMT